MSKPRARTLYDFQPGAGFGHPDGKLNPPIGDAKGSGRFPFQPESVPFQPATRSLTPWSTHRDDGPPFRVGYPAGAPGGLLLTLVHFTSTKPVKIDTASVVFLPTGQVSQSAGSLKVAFDHPRYLEMQPKPLVRYRDMYGIDEPEQHEWLPSETAEPFGFVGTSGVYARETKSFVGNTTTKWGQGGDVGEYRDADIHAIRILVQRPTPRAATHKMKLGWTVSRDERMAVLEEIPLRKSHPDRSPIMDSAGDPDTSFLAKIPADTWFTFQLLNRQPRQFCSSSTPLARRAAGCGTPATSRSDRYGARPCRSVRLPRDVPPGRHCRAVRIKPGTADARLVRAMARTSRGRSAAGVRRDSVTDSVAKDRCPPRDLVRRRRRLPPCGP